MLAAIVTTMLFLPAAVLLAGLFFLVGVSWHAFATFNGVLNAYQGVATWWIIAFLPALAYSVLRCRGRTGIEKEASIEGARRPARPAPAGPRRRVGTGCRQPLHA